MPGWLTYVGGAFIALLAVVRLGIIIRRLEAALEVLTVFAKGMDERSAETMAHAARLRWLADRAEDRREFAASPEGRAAEQALQELARRRGA